jgi:hypothetical protein
LPRIDASLGPAARVTELVRQGNRGAASGRGVYDWSARDPEVLRGARFRELFRWLRVDREARGQ